MRAFIAGLILGLVLAGFGGFFLLHFWRQHRPMTHAASAPVAASPEAISIPRCDGLTPDGNAATWGTQGFRLNVLQDTSEVSGNLVPARAFLAWNASAFLVRVEVDVPTPIEGEREDQIRYSDSVEVHLAAGPDFKQRSQVLVSPGIDPHHPAPRQVIDLTPLASPNPFPAQTIARHTPAGYAVEFSLPWSAYGVTPASGQEVNVQIVVHHRDANGLHGLCWGMGNSGRNDSSQSIKLVLGETASPPVNVLGRFKVLNPGTVETTSTYSPDARGHVLFLQYRDEPIGRFKLGDDGSVSTATFPLPTDWTGADPIVLRDGTRPVAFMTHDDAVSQVKNLANGLDYVFSPSVFDSADFPNGGFMQDGIVRRFFAPVEIHTKFYDAQFNEVTRADKPGRYGAIVQIHLAGCVDLTRYVTLYRTPANISRWPNSASVAAQLPPGIGIDPAVERVQQEQIDQAFKTLFVTGIDTRHDLAVLLAGLSETKAGDPAAVARNDVRARNNDWWYDLREKIGQPEKYQYLIDLPAGYDADPAKKWPLILYLHGGGEAGEHLESVRGNGLAKLVGEGRQFPAIILSPQCPLNELFQPRELNALLDDISAQYRVDPDRIYATGLSLGGFGTWDLATAYPDRLAAIVPICGRGDTRDAARLCKLPIWAFHGLADDAVPVASTIDMITAIRKAGGHEAHMTLYPGVGHPSWIKAYDTDALYTWLFAQKRGQPEVVTPGVPTR